MSVPDVAVTVDLDGPCTARVEAFAGSFTLVVESGSSELGTGGKTWQVLMESSTLDKLEGVLHDATEALQVVAEEQLDAYFKRKAAEDGRAAHK